jgi:hypothetical protein
MQKYHPVLGYAFWLLALGITVFLIVAGGLVTHQLDRLIFGGSALRSLLMDAERSLPIGSTKQQTKEWLNRHGIPFGLIVDENGCEIGFSGSIRDDSWLVSAVIRVHMYFDQQQCLQKRLIYRFEYWP